MTNKVMRATRARARGRENLTMTHDVLGFDLAAERRSRGLTQTELAKVVGTNVQSISRWETGWNTPSVRHVRNLQRWFLEAVEVAA